MLRVLDMLVFTRLIQNLLHILFQYLCTKITFMQFILVILFLLILRESVKISMYVYTYIVVLLYLHKININMGSYIFMCSIIK